MKLNKIQTMRATTS